MMYRKTLQYSIAPRVSHFSALVKLNYSICAHNAPLLTVLDYKKTHFYEIKGDVGMSHHEKEREQEEDRKSFISPSLFCGLFLAFAKESKDILTSKCLHEYVA